MSKWTIVCGICQEIFWSDKLLQNHKEKTGHNFDRLKEQLKKAQQTTLDDVMYDDKTNKEVM